MFLFLLTNVHRFGKKRLLNALNVNVNVDKKTSWNVFNVWPITHFNDVCPHSTHTVFQLIALATPGIRRERRKYIKAIGEPQGTSHTHTGLRKVTHRHEHPHITPPPEVSLGRLPPSAASNQSAASPLCSQCGWFLCSSHLMRKEGLT